MKPIYTVHAGEYLVGTYIEKTYQDLNVWFPSKDRGIDLLVTNQNNTKAVSLQIKFSKDYVQLHSYKEPEVSRGIRCMGWFTLNTKKIRESKADLWVLISYTFEEVRNQFIIIPPTTLLKRLEKIHGKKDRYNTYLWVTKGEKCYEARDLSKQERILLANDALKEKKRDFTEYLNQWDQLIERL
jgi:hypothetical protein